MSNTLHLTATVLPGNRIEVPTPDVTWPQENRVR